MRTGQVLCFVWSEVREEPSVEVLNVVNAVFVQQTMKTASSDEDLAFKQKEKDAPWQMNRHQGLLCSWKALLPLGENTASSKKYLLAAY